jgi:FlaA1/EpsC-like NDP-sugar epimerase
MFAKSLYKNLIVVIAADLVLILTSFYSAHLARFDFSLPEPYRTGFVQLLPWVVLMKLFFFYLFDLYRGMWRYTGITDLLNIIKATTASTAIILVFVLFTTRFTGFSRSVFVIDWCFTVLLIAGLRLAIRVFFIHSGYGLRPKEALWKALKTFVPQWGHRMPEGRGPRKRLLIIGAGNSGEKILREIQDNPHLRYEVMGFLDDNPRKIGMKIHGVPVLGAIDHLAVIAAKFSLDELLIAIPSANASQMRRIVSRCKESGTPFKTIPSMGELINGQLSIRAVREVAYRDLLGREPVKLDPKRIGDCLTGQCVMVTGAGGSIGSELCRQICRFSPSCLLLFERAESPLYDIEMELRDGFKAIELVPVLGDVRDKAHLARLFEQYRIDTIFHAAAYKHVPMLEQHPWKAVENNIQGTLHLLAMANRFAVRRFVLVSTDKAVRPANVMGASKRITEMLVESQNACFATKTRFMIVRFGNVVGSVGSVVPLFKKQIEKGGPVTVTHPEATRYFMTIPEACQLILQAGSMGSGGEIFILDMGTPVKIDDMARDLIKLSGFTPGTDIAIHYTGLRPGEKLYEELITEGEGIVPSGHEKIMVLRGKQCNLEALNGKLDRLFELAAQQDGDAIRRAIADILPEYQPSKMD